MLSSRLNYIRKHKGFTAQQVADYLHINIRSYRAYESADRSPNLDTLVKIADLFDVSIDYLLGRDDFLKSHGVFFDEH
ncbi:MAG: helix-turn-helix transcriptional regulator [Clostridium sp.]|nr:helix-turn-helix transcriptional regulator [Clostridium sp.]MCM1209097.1 helix-turn-helix transcriptional regulator [Ruminococcus sp.]